MSGRITCPNYRQPQLSRYIPPWQCHSWCKRASSWHAPGTTWPLLGLHHSGTPPIVNVVIDVWIAITVACLVLRAQCKLHRNWKAIRLPKRVIRQARLLMELPLAQPVFVNTNSLGCTCAGLAAPSRYRAFVHKVGARPLVSLQRSRPPVSRTVHTAGNTR